VSAHQTLPASFASDSSETAVGPHGQIAHKDHIEHTARFERKLWTVRPGVWCLVGNGLSNQTFIEGPAGLIAIDTGESIEEMADAISEVRQVTQEPIVAVIYTHSHYVGGTKAIIGGDGAPDLPIWGHDEIVANRRMTAVEVGPAASRGAVHQFGLALPPDGEDGLVNVGLSKEFHSAGHAPFTPGFIPPNRTFDQPTTTTLAGLAVHLTPAPSDADDSITIWFPELGVCVNNLVWPTLFNVFAIRGEEYRDPRILLGGLDHILALQPEHLVATHGPPLSGQKAIADDVTKYRDAIQFIWDQTVRGINRGLTLGELCEFVQLPERYSNRYLTKQMYGLVEHHVRQIHAGLRGWFDGDESMLFPLPPAERATRLIEACGGADAVRAGARTAIDANDLRWALELATWLVRRETNEQGRADGGSAADRALLATVLRTIAQRTTAANIRNWCLTRARELDGLADLSGLRMHRFSRQQVMTNPPEAFVHGLRVILDPAKADGIDEEVRWEFADGTVTGLRVRNQVAVPTDGSSAEVAIALTLETWALLLSARTTLIAAIDSGAVAVAGDVQRVRAFFRCFDHTTLVR
jgi:alkyl sulfatase BDS1-like metallo-beta-lactamase superfamily hydrolase